MFIHFWNALVSQTLSGLQGHTDIIAQSIIFADDVSLQINLCGPVVCFEQEVRFVSTKTARVLIISSNFGTDFCTDSLLSSRSSTSLSSVLLKQCKSLDFRLEILAHPLVALGERGGSVVECRTPEQEVRGSRPTAAVLCPWARHFTPRKYWLITQEAMAPSRHDWKIVDWDVKPQHNQPLVAAKRE